MHEMGIVCSVLDAVRSEAGKVPGSRPTRVGLRIGEWSGVDIESLRFCFEALTLGSDLQGLELATEFCTRRNRCDACGWEFVARDGAGCPACNGQASTPISGDELEIAYLELEERGGSDATGTHGKESPE